MKCKDCDYAVKGFFACKPEKHVCIGVKEPFVIEDTNVECTEYPEIRERQISVSKAKYATLVEPKPAKAYVGDDGIYIPSRHDYRCHELLISKDLFIEAYNKWINGKSNTFVGQDDADDWCD